MISDHPLLILAGALAALSLGCGGKSVQGSGGAAGAPTGTGGEVTGGTGGSSANGGAGTGGTGGTGGIAGSTASTGGTGGAGTGGTGGTGGIAGSTASTGGTGGAGTGGTGGSTATDGGAAFELPGCLRALLASCETTGACHTTISDAGSVDQTCFASGVRAAFTQVPNAAGCNGAMGVVQVFKADGSPCYSFEQLNNPNTACESGTITWRDAAGLVVARGTASYGGISQPSTSPAPARPRSPCARALFLVAASRHSVPSGAAYRAAPRAAVHRALRERARRRAAPPAERR